MRKREGILLGITLGKIKTYKLSPSDKLALCVLHETQDLVEQSCLQVAGRILRGRTLFYSCFHKTDGSKNNRICQYRLNGEVGVAEIDFLVIASQPYAMLSTYQISSECIMDIRPTCLHSENTHLLSRYVVYVEKNIVPQKKIVPLSAIVKKGV